MRNVHLSLVSNGFRMQQVSCFRLTPLAPGVRQGILALLFVAMGCAPDAPLESNEPDGGSGGLVNGSGGNTGGDGTSAGGSGGATQAGGTSSGGSASGGTTSGSGGDPSVAAGGFPGVGGTGDSVGGASVGGSGGDSMSSGGMDGSGGASLPPPPTSFANPIIRYNTPDPTTGPGDLLYTADGAGFSWNNKVYLYTGHDEAAEGASGYRMFDWYLFSSADMVVWENVGPVLRFDVFSWARGGATGNANAAHVVQRDDAEGNPKFYFYAGVEGGQPDYGISIGVAVADQPEGPFEDARGIPLIYLTDTANTASHAWRNLDPATFVDDDGRAYMYWGNGNLYWVELEEDMIHIKGETTVGTAPNLQSRQLPQGAVHVAPNPSNYTEAPFLHKRGDTYYMSYASGFPESISYATSTSPTGPWTNRGAILDPRQGTGTVHQSIFDWNGATFISYHDASLPSGGDYRRSTCIDRLYYNDDGTIVKVVPTSE